VRIDLWREYIPRFVAPRVWEGYACRKLSRIGAGLSSGMAPDHGRGQEQMAELANPDQRHWLLQSVDADDVEFLLRNGHQVRFEPGQVVFNEGDETDGLYLVAAGTVRLTATGANGETMIALVYSGEVLGELGVLDGQPRSARAAAVGMCTAYFIAAEPFLDVLERSPGLCMRMMALLTRRLRYANGRLGELAPAAAVANEEMAPSA
jgi:CRP-like cAMP-binding protein